MDKNICFVIMCEVPTYSRLVHYFYFNFRKLDIWINRICPIILDTTSISHFLFGCFHYTQFWIWMNYRFTRMTSSQRHKVNEYVWMYVYSEACITWRIVPILLYKQKNCKYLLQNQVTLIFPCIFLHLINAIFALIDRLTPKSTGLCTFQHKDRRIIDVSMCCN